MGQPYFSTTSHGRTREMCEQCHVSFGVWLEGRHDRFSQEHKCFRCGESTKATTAHCPSCILKRREMLRSFTNERRARKKRGG